MNRTGSILGSAQAEADAVMLQGAFVETPDFHSLSSSFDFSFVVGRRGTGKSALFHKLKEHFSHDSGIITIHEHPQDYEMLELQSLLRPLSSEYRVLRTICRLLWAAHFLVASSDAVRSKYKFSASTSAGFITEYASLHSKYRGIGATEFCLRALRAAVSSQASAMEIPRYLAETFSISEATVMIRTALEDTGVRVVALYDRLDESWSPDVWSISILGGLARASADCREKHLRIHPLLFIRDNMFRALSQYDDDFTRHIEGHSMRLHWDERSLFHLVARRLRIVLSDNTVENETKLWNRFASRGLQGRDGFNRCLRLTLYRPRDILVLLNEAFLNASRDARDHIIESDVERSAMNISQARLEDLCKEYDQVLPGLRLFVGAFRGRPASQRTSQVMEQLEQLTASTCYSESGSTDLALFESPGDMLSALYSVGFLGIKADDTGNFAFCHDGAAPALAALPADRETLVHPCYWKALEVAIDGDVSEAAITVADEYATPKSDLPKKLRLERLGRLPEDLSQIPHGHDGSREFEKWVLRVIRILFANSLTNIELKPNPSTSLNQRDVVGTISASDGFWRRVYDDYGSRQVVFECKNYSELTPDDFRQVLDYSSGEYGKFAVVVRRDNEMANPEPGKALSGTEQDRTRLAYYDHSKLIMVAPVGMLALCVRKLRAPKKYNYAEVTLGKQLDFIVRSVLAMRHSPRFKRD